MSLVLVDKREGYALITLNRPDAMNALSRGLRAELIAAFEDCQRDSAVRVLVITGSGRAFCAGFDLKELGSSTEQDSAEEAGNALQRAMANFEGPIIAAVNGHAITGGFELALACDVILASTEARFADTHARVGILPGWGLSQRLPRLIGLSRAKELSLTGSPLFADKAYEWGLVNHVYAADELLDQATAMAEAMCACVPAIVQQYKALIDRGYSMPLDEAMQWEEQQAIESAKQATAAMVESRRQQVLERGRSETE